MKSEKLMGIGVWMKACGILNGNRVTSYSYAQEVNNEGYSKEKHEKILSAAKSHYESLGYKDVEISTCSKEEAVSGSVSDYTPVGYVEIYVKVNAKKDGSSVEGYAKCDMDFFNYFDVEFWDAFAKVTETVYLENGYTDIEVTGCTKEEYEKNNKEQDPVMYETNWNEQ